MIQQLYTKNQMELAAINIAEYILDSITNGNFSPDSEGAFNEFFKTLVPIEHHTGDVQLLKEGLAHARDKFSDPETRMLYAQKYYDLYRESARVYVTETIEELSEMVDAIKERVGPNHSAFKQAVMDLDQHKDGKVCDQDMCVILFEYNKVKP